MPICGTKYQTFEWEGIKKLLIKAGINTLGEVDTPSTLLHALLNTPDKLPQHISILIIALQEELGLLYKNNAVGQANALDLDTHNDWVSLAIELTDILCLQHKRIEKLLSNILKEAKKNKPAAQWKSSCYKSFSDLFSELRYIKDAENITIATGKSTTAQHVQILAKIEQLNRGVEKAFSDGDIVTLAEITGESFNDLESNPFLLNRYKHMENRAVLIMAADCVFRARKNKQPQLPTKKYNNLVNPDIITKLLSELEQSETVSLQGFNQSDNQAFDWLETFVDVVNDTEEEIANENEQDDFWNSPRTDSTVQTHNETSDMNDACLSVIEPLLKLGLILRMDKNNDIINLLSAEDLTILRGQKLSKATLAKLANKTVHKFDKAIEQTLQTYIVCMKQSIPLLDARTL